MAMLIKRHTVSTLAFLLAGFFIAPVAQAGPLSTAKASATSAVIAVDHDWDDDDDDYGRYYSRRYYRSYGYPRYYGHAYYGRPYYGYGYRRHRHVDVDAPFASVRVRPRGVWVRAPFVRLYVPRY